MMNLKKILSKFILIYPLLNKIFGKSISFFLLHRTTPLAKTTYEAGIGWTTTLREFFENSETKDALRVKILSQITPNMYEAGDPSGICKLIVLPGNANRELIRVYQTIRILTPKCANLDKKIIAIGKACHVNANSSIKIPIHIYNENIQKPPGKVINPICEGCKEEFEDDTILKHITKSKPCKEKYGERFEEMKKERRKLVKEKFLKNTNRHRWNEQAKELTGEDAVLDDLKCEGCGENFLHDRFFKHVSHTKSCKEVYGDRFEAMKKEKRSFIDAMKNKRRKEKNQDKKKANEIFAIWKSQIKLPVRLWKKIRLEDHEKFKAFAGDEDDELNQMLKSMKAKVENHFQRHDVKIETAFDKKKVVREKDAKQTADEFKNFYLNGKKFRSECQEVEKEFEEIAKKLNDELSCFDCAVNFRQCLDCFKKSREKELKSKNPDVGKPNKDNVSLPNSLAGIKTSEKVKEKLSKMIKRSQKEDSSDCQIKQKPLIRKRKRVDFTMEDLENAADDQSDEDFVI